MPLQIPSRSDVVSSLQSFTRAEIPDLDPTVTRRRGFIGGMIKSLSLSLHDFYVMLKKYADREPFPQTATEGFFAQGWWIDITNLPRNPSASAKGSVVFTGSAGTIIPAGTELSASGILYTTDTSVSIVSQSLVGTSSYPGSSVGRFVTVEPHNIGQGQTLTFSGCIDAALNGTFPVNVIDDTTIEYDLEDSFTGTPLEPNPRASGSWANAQITALVKGVSGNLNGGTPLSVSTVIAGLGTEALLTFGGIADGSELETLEAWRARVLQALGTDFGMFSASEIEIVAKTVPGVTRVFIRKPTREPVEGFPLEGQVRIAFLRENDADPIPSSLEVAQVRNKITSLLTPAHTFPADVEVLAPERYDLQVRFISLSPDTPGMRASIRANVQKFLLEEATWGGVLSIEGLRCAIRASFDGETGQGLTSYQLDTPTLDIALPIDAYPVLSSISWSI